MGRVADADPPSAGAPLAPTAEMGSCHRNPLNVQGHSPLDRGHMAVVRLILRLSSSRPRPLAAVPALLRLVVGPCLNAHKRHVRDPLYSFNSLLIQCQSFPDPAPIVSARSCQPIIALMITKITEGPNRAPKPV